MRYALYKNNILQKSRQKPGTSSRATAQMVVLPLPEILWVRVRKGRQLHPLASLPPRVEHSVIVAMLYPAIRKKKLVIL